MLENAQTQGGPERVLSCPCVFSPRSDHGHPWAGSLPPEARSGQTVTGRSQGGRRASQGVTGRHRADVRPCSGPEAGRGVGRADPCAESRQTLWTLRRASRSSPAPPARARLLKSRPGQPLRGPDCGEACGPAGASASQELIPRRFSPWKGLVVTVGREKCASSALESLRCSMVSSTQRMVTPSTCSLFSWK